MDNKIIAIVQARIKARRLPGKMLLHLHGYPIIEWIFKRIKKSQLLETTVFAIPDKVSDDSLAKILIKLKNICFY